VFHRSPVLDSDEIFRSTYWSVMPVGSRVGPILDVSVTKTAEALSLDPTLSSTLHREATQALALNASSAGFVGIVYRLTETVDDIGLALFGAEGRAVPDSGGLPTFYVNGAALAETPEFWTWLDREREAGLRIFVPEQPMHGPLRLRVA
jgi:hypothetical protein